MLLIGLRVATPIFSLLIYSMVYILSTKKLRGIVKILLWFAMMVSVIGVLLWHEKLQDDTRGSENVTVENLGSGCIGNRLERIDILSRRSVPTMLFGSGPGSNSFYSFIWWWEKKDSHHDLLTIIIESGFVGLSATLLFLFLLFRRLDREGLPLIWFLMSGSLVSNALLQRPILATLFWLAVAIAALRIDNKLQISWRKKQKQRPLQRPQTTHPRRQHRHGVGPNPKPAK